MPHDIIDNRESYLADSVRPSLNESLLAGYRFGNPTKTSQCLRT